MVSSFFFLFNVSVDFFDKKKKLQLSFVSMGCKLFLVSKKQKKIFFKNFNFFRKGTIVIVFCKNYAAFVIFQRFFFEEAVFKNVRLLGSFFSLAGQSCLSFPFADKNSILFSQQQTFYFLNSFKFFDVFFFATYIFFFILRFFIITFNDFVLADMVKLVDTTVLGAVFYGFKSHYP